MARARHSVPQANLLNLDPELMKEAMEINKGKTAEQVLNEALRKYIIGVRNREVLDIKGEIYWDGDLNEFRTA